MGLMNILFNSETLKMNLKTKIKKPKIKVKSKNQSAFNQMKTMLNLCQR